MVSQFHAMGLSAIMDSSNGIGSIDKVHSGMDQWTDTALRLETPGSSDLYSIKSIGMKRKRDVFDGAVGTDDGFSLVLGLGRSTTLTENSNMSVASACTFSSAKGTDDRISKELGLKLRLHLGSDSSTVLKKPTLETTKKTVETEPICDLQLSLSSAGPSSSVISTASPSSVHKKKNLETSFLVNGLPLVDEGSTSSRWRSGVSLLTPFHATETVSSFTIDWADPTKDNPFQVMPNLPSIAISKSIQSVTCTSGISHKQHQHNSSSKTCRFRGCEKGARGASGLCIAHGGGRRCQRDGCHKGAEGRTLFCKAHGGGRRCEHFGCTKSAEGRTDFCIAHGGGRRCSHEGCTRAARGRSGLCIRHGGGKRCQRENCSRSAEGQSGLCISHGGGRRCQFPKCTKGAQGGTMLCKAHGGGKRCTAPCCTKGAEGSTPYCKAHGGGKRCSFDGGDVCPKSVHGGTLFCVAHGGGKRCAAPECTRSARGRTDFCVRHGGGKRCKSQGCGKSAQGRTDFCKAHGGGKRCSWGQAVSGLGIGGASCHRLARKKTGLCIVHGAEVQDTVVRGGASLVASPEKMKEVGMKRTFAKIGNHGWCISGSDDFDSRLVHSAIAPVSGVVSLPEGRVHGGSLMAMLARGANAGSFADASAAAGAGPSKQV